MGKIRYIITLWITKVIAKMLRLIAKERGTNLPGSIAIKLCPNFLSYFKMPEKVIAVTGSNGKTSTTHFINQMLEGVGYTVISNKAGSNMAPGIATTLLTNSSLIGKTKGNIAVFEVDERGSSAVYNYITPTYLVCTNLFRDSIMRNGHSEFVKSKIEEKLPQSTTLILNADDLISGTIGENNKKIYYAVDRVDKLDKKSNKNNLSIDISSCPECLAKLEYEYLHYHHIGKAKCTECEFTSPKADFIGTNVNMENGTFVLKEDKKETEYTFNVSELFNVYNIVATIALARVLNIDEEKIKEEVKKLSLKLSRKDEEIVNGKRIVKMLSKDQNPISCSRAMDFVSQSEKTKAVVLIIMNFKGKQDECEDVSWLYDTDFEYLKQDSVKQIIIGGKRALDILVRLEMAGIDRNIIDIDMEVDNIPKMLKKDEVEEVYILHSLYAATKAKNIKQEIIKKIEG